MMAFFRASVLVLLGLASLATAKSAEDYLHGGAAKYVQGRIQEASVEVEEGLRLFPNDPMLKALGGQLQKMKDQKKQDKGGSDSKGGDGNQEKKDKQEPEQGKDGQGKDQKQDPEKDKPEEKEKPGKDEEKDKGAGEAGDKPPKEDGKQGDSTGQAAPVPPGEMSKEEAERLLNSYQDDEKREQKNLQKRYRKPVEVEEDW